MTRVLILGFGKLGDALVRRHADRYDFRGVKRAPIEAPPCPMSYLPIDDDRITEHLAWADHVVFCPAAPASDDGAYRATYLDNMAALTRRLIERRITPRSVILISSTGVYPESVDEPIDEDYQPVVESDRQNILLQTEHALIQSDLPYVIFRCAGLYGGGHDAFRERLADGRINSTMLTNQYVHFIHLHDVCDAVDLAIRRNLTAQIYNLVDDSMIRRADFYRFLSTLYGLPILDRGSARATGQNRLITNAKAKTHLGLTLSSPRITDYLAANAARR
ncbi:MAG: NAD-dependent epimerase/dehydratase family protein [Nitrospirota bacterium]